MSVLAAAYFHDEAAAVAKLEELLWPDGPVCPKCGVIGHSYPLKGKTARPGLRKCGACRKQFTVKIGTVFESSHVPLHKWFQAAYLLSCSKKGVSAHQLHRILEVTYKTAWFMAHRLREAMRVMGVEPMGGEGETVEIDETFIGNDRSLKPKGQKRGRGYGHKYKVLSLVHREGRVRSFHVGSVKARELLPIIQENVASESKVMTDEAGQYRKLKEHFVAHGVVRHKAGEYGRGPIHTNTVEGYFSIFKRGMKGVYQHCAPKHLHRYLAEFDFRYNEREITDWERTGMALLGAVGKRLTYRDSLASETTGGA